ncbi:MAG: hypothetical protein H7Y18_13210 [Clostridiaceae bacterium]|nr:hypothetical protein [Clostridiaceae bacterium]
MDIVNATKKIFNVFITLVLFILIFSIIINPKINIKKEKSIIPFSFNDKNITYDNDNSLNLITDSETDKDLEVKRTDVINRAKAMAEVKWIPKYDIKNSYGNYTFKKGKTYTGIPYTMDIYQVSSVSDFLAKIKDSKEVYGNDCSGFVSIAWGISRQTTLTLFNSVKHGSIIDGHLISEISWDDLKPGDALLKDNGKGDGHIILYNETDDNNSDNIFVYEQNISTKAPFETLPVARKGTRSKVNLKNNGYFPIRLQGLI